MTLINTRLQNFRAQSPTIDTWQYRTDTFGAWQAFLNQSADPMGIITDDMKSKAIAASGSTLEVPVLDFEATTIQNVTQPLVVIGNELTSQLMAVSFVDYYFGFLIHPAKHFNNEISMQREFNTQLRRYVLELLNEWDQAAVTALEASKTQVLGDGLGGRYSLVSDAVRGALAEADAMVGDINPIMRGNRFFGPFDMVGNPSMESHVRNRLLEQGQFNDRNKTYQYGDKNWYWSNNVANAAATRFTGYAIQKGTVGVLFQFLPDNVIDSNSNNHDWDIEAIPGLGASMGTYTYDGAVDGSGLAGAATTPLTATKQEAHGFHVRVGFVTNYISDRATIASPQAKFEIATT